MTFTQDESVLVRNQRGKKVWLPGKIIRQKGPVTYIVQVGTQTRFCHVDHLLKTGVKATIEVEEEDEISDVVSSSQRDEGGDPSNLNRPENDTGQSETATGELPRVNTPSQTITSRHSSRIRQPTKRLIEEI